MPKSKKRKTSSTGQRNQQRFRAAVMDNVLKSNPSLVYRQLTEQYEWINLLDEDTKQDCLEDLSLSLQKASTGDRADFERSLEVWETVALRNS